jgi:hypothetical protein
VRPLITLFLVLITSFGCTTVTAARRAAIAATAADTATTIVGLNRGNVEVNPLYGSYPRPAKILIINAALTAAVWYLAKNTKYERQVWTWIAVFRCGAIVWNGKELNRGR